MLLEKPWLSPLGAAAAYEDVAASLRTKGHAFATGFNCFEKVQQLHFTLQDLSIERDVPSDADALPEACQTLLAQVHAEASEFAAAAALSGTMAPFVMTVRVC